MNAEQNKKVILTGDRPTGQLHLGHYVGSLANRVALQDEYNQFILLADIQALTDNYENPQKVRDNAYQVLLDYLAVGIDPHKSTIFLQSQIPQIAELTVLFMNLVTLSRLKRNPTVKAEMALRGFDESVPVGFLVYPVSQAADITIFKADLVPVGEDQAPMIEQTNELVRSFNRIYGPILKETTALIPKTGGRLIGTDGKARMSKSLGNTIFLNESSDSLAKKVKGMYTDPTHLKVEDPGKIEGNTVFTYLDIFDPDTAEVTRLKEHYMRGGLGDSIVKKRLLDVLENFIAPIRTRRAELAQNMDYIENIAREGTLKARAVASQTMLEIRRGVKIDYFD